jgi:hypothetical protein
VLEVYESLLCEVESGTIKIKEEFFSIAKKVGAVVM